jgi:Sec-independent protein secretion pathway component TatC|tara:strand:+ start:46 stop:267 length:222 start_codon:yes stop_codon:yes gene_type:complete
MKKYRNIIIAFFVGVLASFFVWKGMVISKKKQIKKDRIEKRMDMKKDPILNDSIRMTRIQMLKNKKKRKKRKS